MLIIIELLGWESPNIWVHPVLYIQEVGFYVAKSYSLK